MKKYRIYEQHNVFYVEKLEKFLFWSYYSTILKNGYTSDYLEFKTLEEAKEYIKGCEIKYYNIN